MTVEEAERAFRERMQKDTPPHKSLYYEMDHDIRRWQEDRAILRKEREQEKSLGDRLIIEQAGKRWSM
jgi:hypothetical protein